MPSQLAVARSLPSRLNATELTASLGTPVTAAALPQGRADLAVGGHIPQPAVPSQLAVTSFVPSGLNATAVQERRG